MTIAVTICDGATVVGLTDAMSIEFTSDALDTGSGSFEAAVMADVGPDGTVYIVGQETSASPGVMGYTAAPPATTVAAWGTTYTPYPFFRNINYDSAGDQFICRGYTGPLGGATDYLVWLVQADGTPVQGWIDASNVINLNTNVLGAGFDPATRLYRFSCRMTGDGSTDYIYELNIDDGTLTRLFSVSGQVSVSTRRSDGAIVVLHADGTLDFLDNTGTVLSTFSVAHLIDPVNDFICYGDLAPDGSAYYVSMMDNATYIPYLAKCDPTDGSIIGSTVSTGVAPVLYFPYGVRAVETTVADLTGVGMRRGTTKDVLSFGRYKEAADTPLTERMLAWAKSGGALSLGATPIDTLAISWSSGVDEYFAVDITLQGTASAAGTLTVAVVRVVDDAVMGSWDMPVVVGKQTLPLPFVLDQLPGTTYDYKLRLSVDAGAFAIDAGDAQWRIARHS